ncbi:biorientation of chromosomes in cell division protein 1-like 1 isoform X2 [Leguminivora glycinivorella]|uniref:biorientation of chromosomes in cell division protein 1-like 1 isoform X2 n=1 Tax=Leguminivora glycinivorella TaxID=1035111 RepID=UPI00200F1B93|nr:biorientation of chromosomes in cell division protein 1-like 1 isoform X2 [Leguminivora glycinivorella]XP_047989579.1 biorientation of chromosomes in cell division protein 1-like 1 isoform X2 [Leguminivora glycinivorella]
MACVQNPSVQADSEREEGEIVDELDELSDISSEEEFLLRQRLHMLEKYNNVLERKNAKRTSVTGPGKKCKDNDAFLCDLSEISATELEEPYVVAKDNKEQKHLKSYHKPKRRKDPLPDNNLAKRVYRKKSNKTKKRATVLSESSDESDDEYRNKRRKLAVAVNKGNVDKSTLKARLEKMLCGTQNPEHDRFFPNLQSETHIVSINNEISIEKVNTLDASNEVNKDSTNQQVYESVDLCSDIDTKDSGNNGSTISVQSSTENYGSIISVPSEIHSALELAQETVQVKNITINETQNTRDSDEDLELLREHALKTKAVKNNSQKIEVEKQNIQQTDVIDEKDALLLSGDEDSDTAELRLICLKSALLKKAFERKQKQKLKKRLSQSMNLDDELMRDQIEYMNQMLSDNNTDIESVDMDIGSDGDEKSKDSLIESLKPTNIEYEKVIAVESTEQNGITELINPKEDEFEEDEDLLRAKLLTSLSKNLPNLIHPNDMSNITNSDFPKKDSETEKQVNNIPEEKRFIISIGNSDSEGEHEATKNLTKMHMKLSEQADFQQKLDMFLKSTRMEVEKSVLPDVVQQPIVPPVPKTKEKFVPKTVNHLPKSEQIEYKNLVKRMAELEKIKNARQSSIMVNKETKPMETLKPRNFGTREQLKTSKDLEEQIALSRKTIAEESAKVLKLKEEATKLSHKYKIVSTELRNIATAITLNKKQQKVAQIKLSKIRSQHQLLINSSATSKHSIPNGNIAPKVHGPQKLSVTTKRPQKENAPVEEVKTVQLYNPSTHSDLQSVKVSVVNDRMEEPNPRLSVQIDVANNKKTVKLPKDPVKNTFIENCVESKINDGNIDVNVELVDRGKKDVKELSDSNWGSKNKLIDDDYKSPLQALGSAKCIHNRTRKCACFNYRFRFK